MERKAWFCPSCQKHHGPHVDTCPGPVDAVSDRTMPVVPRPSYPNPAIWPGVPLTAPGTIPDVSPLLYPQVFCGVTMKAEDGMQSWNGLVQ